MAERPGLRPDEWIGIPFRRKTDAPRGGFSTRRGRRLLLAGDPVRAPRAGTATTVSWIGRGLFPVPWPGGVAALGPPRPDRSVAARSLRSRRRFGSPAERASLATGRGESRTGSSYGGIGTLLFWEGERSQGVGVAGYAGNRGIVSISFPHFGGRWQAKPDGWGLVAAGPFREDRGADRAPIRPGSRPSQAARIRAAKHPRNGGREAYSR